MTTALAAHWALDPDIAFLNHGSFGACPFPVLEAQRELRERMEREPIRFLVRELPALLDAARAVLGELVGAGADDLAFVPNATTGVNTVLRSLAFAPGDELLTTDHAYRACRNALDFVADRAGARVVTAPVPFPVADADAILDAVLGALTERTRLALLDHVTSPTGVVLPIERLVAELAARGVDTLVDGAHAPGMLALDLRALGAAYYTGNAHKWLCAPKGAAFLWVRPDRQRAIRPLTISHGASAAQGRAGAPLTHRSRFRLEFDWTGTDDPTAYLVVPAAIRFLGSLLPGGLPEVMARNHTTAVAARRTICEALGVAEPCPASMLGSLASVPLPDGAPRRMPDGREVDPLQDVLLDRFAIEVPVIAWPAPPRRLVRVSAQLYNTPEQYDRLAAALVSLGLRSSR